MTEQPMGSPRPESRSPNAIPDLKWVNRYLPMQEICASLDLRFGPGGMIHCWRPERHENGDRTPSVSIHKSTNRLLCFGCGSKSLSVVDVVMDVLSTDVAGAVRWLRDHFELKYISTGRHLKDSHAIPPYKIGYEQPIELLVKSGLWANLEPPTQRIVPVLLYFAERGKQPNTLEVRLSYRAIQRYSGVRSFETISKALRQLEEIGWLNKVSQRKPDVSPLREVNTYILTPHVDVVMELANATAAATRIAVAQERELRTKQRKMRRQKTDVITATAPITGERAALQSTPLYAACSVAQNSATPSVAGYCARRTFRRLDSTESVRHRLHRTGATLGRALSGELAVKP